MLLRRVIEHVKAQNWTAIGIDFIIVIVGVFIGIQVSNWNEDRQNASRTQSYYNRLVDDLESERRGLLARLDYMAVVEKYGRYALEVSDNPEAMASSRFLIAAYQASQIWTYAVQRATYDEILSSGVAEAIPDPELRTQLANFYLNADAVGQILVATTPYRQNVRLYLPDDIQSAIRQSCSDRYIATEENLLILKLPQTCPLKFRENQISAALAALRDYSMFERELVQRLAAIDVKGAAVNGHLQIVDSLIEELKRRRR